MTDFLQVAAAVKSMLFAVTVSAVVILALLVHLKRQALAVAELGTPRRRASGTNGPVSVGDGGCGTHPANVEA